MSKTIWKFPLEVCDRQAFHMPEGAQILCVQVQGIIPCLWALVIPGSPLKTRWFAIYGTGHEVDEPGKYVGTFQMHGGGLIFHVFEVSQ